MVGQEKKEFPALLPMGFHPKALDGLRDLCVTPFPRSKTRPAIMQGLETVVFLLEACAISMEVWVDGSFLTRKVDPEDSDVVTRITSDDFERASESQQLMISRLAQSDLKSQYKCDFYFFIEYSRGHELEAEGQWMRSYWIRQFGFSRDQEPKGLAVVRIPLEKP